MSKTARTPERYSRAVAAVVLWARADAQLGVEVTPPDLQIHDAEVTVRISLLERAQQVG